MAILAKIEITMHDTGRVEVNGTGQLLTNKAFVYGLLELAKESLREPPRVQPANPGDLSRLKQ